MTSLSEIAYFPSTKNSKILNLDYFEPHGIFLANQEAFDEGLKTGITGGAAGAFFSFLALLDRNFKNLNLTGV